MIHSAARLPLLLLLVFSCAALGQTPVALTGTVVTLDAVLEHGTVLIEAGRITAVGVGLKLPAGTRSVSVDGILAPGLIDLHNHLTWNVFPRWKPIEEFGSRYDWQAKPMYNVLLPVPHAAMVADGLDCAMDRYAEVKALTEGETSLTGSDAERCPETARELDRDPMLPGTNGKILYNVFPLQMSEAAVADAKAVLAAQPAGALLIHLSEGAPHDATAAREFTQLKARGLLLPGVSLIHAVAIPPAGFAEMAKAGVGMVWSPRSNLELYGDTADVAAAKAAGVTLALAPDWSPTGSVGLLGELNYASVWSASQHPAPFSDRELFAMATTSAARLVHLSDQLGALAPGHAADLIVLRAVPGKDPFWTLTHSGPEDLELVMVGGRARATATPPCSGSWAKGSLNRWRCAAWPRGWCWKARPFARPSGSSAPRCTATGGSWLHWQNAVNSPASRSRRPVARLNPEPGMVV